MQYLVPCRLDIDFSEQLKKRHMEPASSSLSSDSRNMATGQVKPTQADSRRWERSGRFRARVSVCFWFGAFTYQGTSRWICIVAMAHWANP